MRGAMGVDRLAGLRQEGTGRRFQLDAERRAYVIGSGPDADIRVANAHVSAMHCALVREPDGAMTVIDRASCNGTFVDGVRIERARLRSGARLSLGTVTLIVYGPDDGERLSKREAARARRMAAGRGLVDNGLGAAARLLRMPAAVWRALGGRR